MKNKLFKSISVLVTLCMLLCSTPAVMAAATGDLLNGDGSFSTEAQLDKWDKINSPVKEVGGVTLAKAAGIKYHDIQDIYVANGNDGIYTVTYSYIATKDAATKIYVCVNFGQDSNKNWYALGNTSTLTGTGETQTVTATFNGNGVSLPANFDFSISPQLYIQNQAEDSIKVTDIKLTFTEDESKVPAVPTFSTSDSKYGDVSVMPVSATESTADLLEGKGSYTNPSYDWRKTGDVTYKNGVASYPSGSYTVYNGNMTDVYKSCGADGVYKLTYKYCAPSGWTDGKLFFCFNFGSYGTGTIKNFCNNLYPTGHVADGEWHTNTVYVSTVNQVPTGYEDYKGKTFAEAFPSDFTFGGAQFYIKNNDTSKAISLTDVEVVFEKGGEKTVIDANDYKGKVMSVNNAVYNNTAANACGLVITTLYDNGYLVSADVADFSVAANANTVVCTNVEVPSTLSDEYELKTHTWGDFVNCTPLTEVVYPEAALKNGGFEVLENNFPKGWVNYKNADTISVCEGGKDSAICMKLTTTTDNILMLRQTNYDDFIRACGFNGKYQVTYDYKAESSDAGIAKAKINAGMVFHLTDNSYPQKFSGNVFDADGKWHTATFELDMSSHNIDDMDANTLAGYIRFNQVSSETNGTQYADTVYIDNVRLTFVPNN